MGQTFPTMPTAWLPNSTEQPLVKSALIALRDVVNGNIDADNITNGSVATAELAAGAVTLAKMAVNSVDSDQYVDGSIDTAHLASDSVTTVKIADDQVTGPKLFMDPKTQVLGSDSSTTTTTQIDVLSTGVLTGGGQWLIVASGTAKMTDDNTGELRLMGVGFELCECQVFANGGGSDVLMPFSLCYVGTIASGFAATVGIKAPSGGIISIKAGSRISAVRVG